MTVAFSIRAPLGLALLSLASLAVAQDVKTPPLVADVIVVGNRKIPTEKVLCYVYTKPGRALSTEEAQEDVQRLMDSKLFQSIQIFSSEVDADGRIRVTVKVKEHPNIVREVIYRHRKDVNIEAIVKNARVRRGRPLDVELNKTVCSEIQESLQRQGYRFAEVTLDEGNDEMHERVVFNIMAGPTVRVRDVALVGNSDWIEPAKLEGLLNTRPAFIRAWGDIFQPDVIDKDAQTLLQAYRYSGFFEAKVAYELCWCEDFQYVDVTLRIKEGARYRVADWSLDSGEKLPRAELERLIKLKKGDYCTGDAVNADKQRLADWGGKQGKKLWVRSAITPVPNKGDLVNIVFEVEDAPADRVGAIIIVGNTVTKDEVIRKQLGLHSGQILDYTQLPIIEEKLRDLGIFHVDAAKGTQPKVTILTESAKLKLAAKGSVIRPANLPRLPDERGVAAKVAVLKKAGRFKDILIEVEETRTGRLLVGFGVNTEVGPILNVVLEERNFDPDRWPTSWDDFWEGKAFRGSGQKFRFEGRIPFMPAFAWFSALVDPPE